MAINLSSYVENRTLKNIQKLLYEAFSKTVCCNGPFPEPEDREKVFKAYSDLFNKLVNKKL